ncbi:MAG: hypothetical protein WKF86_05875 [Acidimicrobiales bacterium]
MTKRKRILLGGAVAVLLALIPGSAGADTIGSGGDGCADKGATEAPVSLS